MYLTVTPWGRAGFNINKIPSQYILIQKTSIVKIEGIKDYILENMEGVPKFETILSSSESRIKTAIVEASDSIKDKIPVDDISAIKEDFVSSEEQVISEEYGVETIGNLIDEKNTEKIEKINEIETEILEDVDGLNRSISEYLQQALDERGWY